MTRILCIAGVLLLAAFVPLAPLPVAIAVLAAPLFLGYVAPFARVVPRTICPAAPAAPRAPPSR